MNIDKMKHKKDCLSYAFFKSFKDDYFDESEPDNQGFCKNGESKYFGNEGAGEGVLCECYEKFNKDRNGKE